MKKLFVLSILLMSFSGSKAAPFQNLNFDQANTNTTQFFPSDDLRITPGVGPISDLLPGWQLFYGTNEASTFGYNWSPPGGVVASLYVRDESYYVGFLPVDRPFSLIQTGDIPSNAKLIRFYTPYDAFNSIHFELRVNGKVVQLEKDPTTFFPSPTYAIADISQYSGQNVTLDFVTLTAGFLANITFVLSERVFVENDLNGDGAPDVVFEHQDGSAGVWFMNKGPDLISSTLFNPDAVADPRWHIVGTGNFTKTNKTDLLFQHEDGSLAVWSMDGTNLVSAALLNPSQPGEGWKVVGTGDMNHDGQKDILFQHTDGTLVVWLMSGITLVQNPFLNPKKPEDSGWRVVGTAALTSTGNTDLIFQHTDGTLAAWYMEGTNLVRGVLLNPATPGEAGWRVSTTVDLNGDGKTDLLFQHDDGTVAAWFMDGINLISGQLLNPENPGAGWRIAGPR